MHNGCDQLFGRLFHVAVQEGQLLLALEDILKPPLSPRCVDSAIQIRDWRHDVKDARFWLLVKMIPDTSQKQEISCVAFVMSIVLAVGSIGKLTQRDRLGSTRRPSDRGNHAETTPVVQA